MSDRRRGALLTVGLVAVVIAMLVAADLRSGYRPVPASSLREGGAFPVTLESQAWLAAGTVPGSATRWSPMAERALLDLRALTDGHGGVVAAWHGPWAYVWPRDASFAAAAYCLTGHTGDGARVLDFLGSVQRGDGVWEARYHPDGRSVDDSRPQQLDANGWVPWAAWLCATVSGDAARHWPVVRAAADAAVRLLGEAGLPPQSQDYWEVGSGQTLGTAAPLLAGLRAAADLAARLGRWGDSQRYAAAARRLAQGIAAAFGESGYRRSPNPSSGYDTAIAFLAPPFGPHNPAVPLGAAADRLAVPNGGLKPGENWRGHPGEAWTPETALFALAAASSGDSARATSLLDWLDAHRTASGALPERVSAEGDPVSVAPLSWTAATTLLALAALDSPLPIPGGAGAAARTPAPAQMPRPRLPAVAAGL